MTTATTTPTAGTGERGLEEVLVRIPPGHRCQLVYRMERSEPFGASAPEGVEFAFRETARGYLRDLGAYRRVAGRRESIKGLVRILMGRKFYRLSEGGRLVHTGWVTLSHCRHYRVRKGDAVIGPIWSDGRARGRGLATIATRMAIDAMIARGARVFWIDTTDTNAPCLKVIEKCGWGDAAATYLR